MLKAMDTCLEVTFDVIVKRGIFVPINVRKGVKEFLKKVQDVDITYEELIFKYFNKMVVLINGEIKQVLYDLSTFECCKSQL